MNFHRLLTQTQAENNCVAPGYSRFTQGENPLLHIDYEFRNIPITVGNRMTAFHPVTCSN